MRLAGALTDQRGWQVVRELKRSGYGKTTRMCVLSSREHSCVHPQVSKAGNKNEECRKLHHEQEKVRQPAFIQILLDCPGFFCSCSLLPYLLALSLGQWLHYRHETVDFGPVFRGKFCLLTFFGGGRAELGVGTTRICARCHITQRSSRTASTPSGTLRTWSRWGKGSKGAPIMPQKTC